MYPVHSLLLFPQHRLRSADDTEHHHGVRSLYQGSRAAHQGHVTPIVRLKRARYLTSGFITVPTMPASRGADSRVRCGSPNQPLRVCRVTCGSESHETSCASILVHTFAHRLLIIVASGNTDVYVTGRSCCDGGDSLLACRRSNENCHHQTAERFDEGANASFYRSSYLCCSIYI